ncbi:conserved hypothetical protein [Escherichia fergusonii ATCC 35469]|uniref:Uncharacterized protein n=1 Tax=Escherichia fergusonii (strain ATCC 35469 / DSM 13698 / CCUG 18766 / IAM 14443 / JCM 21226 / LMG 7866 / NBRC 102419 / NCTC 12128 / CDC 0568-73) TaxID=585054 RepID=B7LM36_ESCF3|nr:conserved hypothetical protein [Escherichia fergusonii ATCC 35469]
MLTWLTSTSHIKIQIIVQNNNCEGQRSKHFVICTHYHVFCASLKQAYRLIPLSRQIFL